MGEPSVDPDRDRDSDYDRDSALLTPTQRAYYRGKSDIDPGSSRERVVRQRTRQRLRDGVLDLGLLAGNIEDRDLERSFDDDWEPGADDPFGVIHLFNQVSPALSLVFAGTSLESKYPTATEPGEDAVPETLEMFESFVTDAIGRMYVDRGLEVESVDVSIDVSLGDGLDDLAERDLRDLSESRLEQLLTSGAISPQRYAAAVQGVDVGEEQMTRVGPDTEEKGEMLMAPVPDDDAEDGEQAADRDTASEEGGEP
jgi:hypothetical protein